MASAEDKDIVIECSPYSDTNVEIKNLKSPSYEIISTPDIFEYGEPINIFLQIIFVIFMFGFLAFIFKAINSILSNSIFPLDNVIKALYVMLAILGIICLFIEITDSNIPYYILAIIIIILLIPVLLFKSLEKKQTENKLKKIGFAIFPFFDFFSNEGNNFIVTSIFSAGVIAIVLFINTQIKEKQDYSVEFILMNLFGLWGIIQAFTYLKNTVVPN